MSTGKVTFGQSFIFRLYYAKAKHSSDKSSTSFYME